jgi:O-antigen ligase
MVLPFPRIVGSVAALDVGAANSGVTRVVVDALWIIFFIGATFAAYPLGLESPERLVWFPADIAVVALFMSRKREFLELMKSNAIVVSWPALACLSAAWSFAPGMSLYHGLQLFMTVMVGFMLLMWADLKDILRLLFYSLFVCAVLSLVYVQLNPHLGLNEFGEWLGVFPHKNVLGGMMALMILVGLPLLFQGWRPLLTIAGLALAALLLSLSRSAAALSALVPTLLFFPVVVAFRKGWAAVLITVALMIIAVSLSLLFVEDMNIDLIETALSKLGKDSTLTGRTILWDIGSEAFDSRPWLGFGFKGYWEGAGTSAPYLRFVIGQDLWFFHNNFIEVAVAFGFIGPVILGLGYCFLFYRAAKLLLGDRQFVNCWPMLFGVFVLIFCNAENPLFINHGLYQLLFVVAAGAGSRGVSYEQRAQ